MVCDVLGGGEAQGICGSGLVDAVAACAKPALFKTPASSMRKATPSPLM